MKLFCKNNPYKRKHILIYGLGKSGIASKKFLESNGAKVWVYCDGDKIKFNFDNIDLVVVSPGVALDSPVCQEFIKRKIKIISELELGYLNLNGKLVAITGTNGKTTTTALVGKIIENENTFVAGNIGLPLISLYRKTDASTITICEASSFQLETIDMFHPNISAILNIAPDHLFRHKTFENYIECKKNIYKNQTKNDILILNYDDWSKNICENTQVNKYFFSTFDQFDNSSFKGTYVSDGEIYFKENFENTFIMNTKSIKLLGKKNLENVLAAVLISKLLGISNSQISQRIENFLPLKHRLEIVYETKKIRYINDSKATNVASAIADISCLDGKSVVLFGGSDKGESFDILFKNLDENVIMAVVFGETKEKLINSAKKVGFDRVKTCENICKAIKLGEQICFDYCSDEKINLILAPACASFDEFSNYEERGETFRKIAKGGNV